MKKEKRNDRIKRLHQLGWTLEAIGESCSPKITSQRVHQILIGYKGKYKLRPVEKLVRWNKRKREALGLGEFETYNLGGGREFINELVRSRDNHTCQICGKKWQEGQRRFDVHHTDEALDGKNRFKGILEYNRKNFDKLITLCHKCHLNLDVSKERMRNKLSPAKSRIRVVTCR